MEYRDNPYRQPAEGGFAERNYAEAFYLPPEKPSKLPKILLLILIVVAAAFLFTGAVYIASGSGGNQYRRNDPTPQKVVNQSRRSTAKLTTYNGLGQMRPITRAEPDEQSGAVMVVSPWFSFPDGDTPLYEEISQKDRLIKSIIYEYFTGHTKSELLETGEKQIKEELTRQINEQLVMGQITRLYFDEYQFFQ